MDYYVSPLGDDSNSGLSEKQPWRSIERVNATELLPGDSVWFKADQTFFGNLRLAKVKQNQTDETRVVTIGSYGSGRAMIHAGSGTGFVAKNRGGVHLINLNLIFLKSYCKAVIIKVLSVLLYENAL